MNTDNTPTTLRRWLPALVGIGASLLISSFSVAYVTLAAPQRSVTVPNTVGFEGRLADSSGSPVADGGHAVTFSLYGQATGGDPLWTEGQTVTTHSGLYSTQLGTTTLLQPSTFDGPRWLGVTVGGNEMSPRIPISSVPFALNAQEAAHAEQADEADQALGLQGRSVSADAPTDGQALIWDAPGSEWHPGTIEVPDNYEYPRRAFGFHINDKVVTGNQIYCQVYSSQLFNQLCYQNTPANSDTFTTSFMLQAGTYTLSILGQTCHNRGKIDWYVDNVLQISGQDWYEASCIVNIVESENITVLGDGYHVLKGVINGKNASSTGYYMVFTEWWIAPASD